jgi:hypothetical protein
MYLAETASAMQKRKLPCKSSIITQVYTKHKKELLKKIKSAQQRVDDFLLEKMESFLEMIC